MSISGRSSQIMWVPRILAILCILFFSVFAWEAFSVDMLNAFPLVAFFIQMIPSLIMIVLLILSWKKPVISGWAFIVLGVFFIFFLIRIDSYSIFSLFREYPF